jgi:CRISPR-associated protein Cmr1
MARTIPACPSPPDAKGIQKCLSYEIALVTPMFGGGVDKGDNDQLTPIRGTAIRGHLRFWWRATRGARFSTFKELKKVEDEIWGCTEKKGAVSLQVEILKQGKTEVCAEFKPGKKFPDYTADHPGYVLFPFAQKDHGPRKGVRELAFKLTLTLKKPAEAKEIEAALWAWVNFGGLGARTRRGCGTLFCKVLAPNGNNIKDWYGKKLNEYGIKPGSAREWSTIPGVDGLLINPSQAVPMKAWNISISTLKKFRQGVNSGRNPGADAKTPGRSRWPEPDSIREITGKSALKHSKKITPISYFPRAEFGLPIVFHFKDLNEKNEKDSDPYDCELLPGKNYKRMASPIVIKPLVVETHIACPIILYLVKNSLKNVKLIDSDTKKETSIDESQIRNRNLSSNTQYPNSPMNGTPSPYSALDAFMNFARKEGYK